jgi:hypothetical protein
MGLEYRTDAERPGLDTRARTLDQKFRPGGRSPALQRNPSKIIREDELR